MSSGSARVFMLDLVRDDQLFKAILSYWISVSDSDTSALQYLDFLHRLGT
jgi:hypothetical protein